MSSRSATKANQKIHKERLQPATRKHLGLLEKKKDYKLRARDQNEKKETLQLLYRKAANKNPDEFYHHMITTKITDGEHHEMNEKNEHSKEQIELMQTQDLKYVRMKRNIEARKIKRLELQLNMTDTGNATKNSHIFFIPNETQIQQFNVAKRLQTASSLLHRKINRTKIKDLGSSYPSIDDNFILAREEGDVYKELSKRIDRKKELTLVQRKLELKILLEQKRLIKPKKIKSGTKNNVPVYLFKYERKK